MNLLPQQFLDNLCTTMRAQANSGTWNGKEWTDYFANCRHQIRMLDISMIFTRDTGGHSGGWFKNPDYERCYHLSIRFPDGFKRNVATQIAKALFGDDVKKVWIEPPYTDRGKQSEIYHYRLMCNEAWEPIQPIGEVYTTFNTPVGWKSFSELHDGKKPIIRPSL